MPQLATRLIDYEIEETVFEGYLSHLDGLTHPSPCILLAHEWSGLNNGMRAVADRIAALGYVVFAMDLYGKGVRGSETGDNTHLMQPLLDDRDLLRRRLLGGIEAARREPVVDPGRLAAIGHCFGGLCALDMARANPEGLLAVVTFHAVLTKPDIPGADVIRAGILILHGWEDPIAPPADVLAIAEELTAAKADWQIHAYGHTKHAFTFEGAYFPERGIVYNPVAAKRAWSAMQSFLEDLLGSS